MKFVFLFFCSCLFSSFIYSQDSTQFSFTEMITADKIKSHLELLASDEYEGRGSGERGQKKAAAYISNYFKNIGLEPYDKIDSTYLQPFEFRQNKIEQTGFQHFIRPTFKNTIPKTEYYFQANFEIFNEKTKVIWVGYGFDYSNIDVNDKIVIVWLSTPPDSILEKYGLNDSKSNEINSFILRQKIAKENGAKGIFFIHPDNAHFKLYQARNKMMAKLQRKPKSFFQELSGFPTVYFNTNAASSLLKLSQKKFDTFINNQTARTTKVKLNFARPINPNSTENIIGIIPGTSKKHEYIFITAHYDHLGIMDGRIHNGADDNASGTSALLALAATFSAANKAGFTPERNIVFVAISGEELGLLGSEFLTNNLQIPHSSIHALYNIDMIGRAIKNKKNKLVLYIVGTDNCIAENKKIAAQYFPNINLNYTYNRKNHPEKIYYRSDHYNFARFGVPFIYFTSGFHSDYHLPSDDSEHINYEGIELITRLIFRNIQTAANSN